MRSYGLSPAWTEPAGAKIFGGIGEKAKPLPFGFRSTASTLLNENGHHPDVIEAALAHVRGDIRSIYNRAKYLPERVKLYQWWADYVDGLRQQGSQLNEHP